MERISSQDLKDAIAKGRNKWTAQREQALEVAKGTLMEKITSAVEAGQEVAHAQRDTLLSGALQGHLKEWLKLAGVRVDWRDDGRNGGVWSLSWE